MTKNYVIKPKTQDSAEFRKYIRNVMFEYDKQIQKLDAIEDKLEALANEMKKMPEDGQFDVGKISDAILENRFKVNTACYQTIQTLEAIVKEREDLLANPEIDTIYLDLLRRLPNETTI